MDRIKAWGPRALAMVGFGGYALLAPPGPYWLDSSELAAAWFQLGSPHPTGFPLLCMLAKLVSLVPVGEIGFRMHLASSACAALAMLWTARMVERAASAGRGQGGASGLVGGLAGGLLIGVTLTFARQATVTEVYAPTAALLAATALLFDRVARGGDARLGLLLSFVAGLGLGAHVSYRLLVPLPLVALLWIRLRRGARWPLAAPLVALSVGAALHLYLPVRAASGRTAAVDWGHPRDLQGLAAHVTGQAIRDSFADEMMATEPEIVRHDAGRFLGAMADESGVLGLVAALAGAASLLIERRSRWLLALLATMAIGDAIVAVWLNPMGIADRQNGVPLLLAIGTLAGFGVAWLGRFAGERAGPAVAAAAGIMLLVGPAMVAWPAVSPAASGEAPRRLAEAALEATPPRGLVLSRSDSLSALLLFLSTAEGARPDAALLVRQRLGDLERTRAVTGASMDPERPLLALDTFGRTLAWELGDDPVPATIEMRSVVGLIHPRSNSPGAPPTSRAGSSSDIIRAAGRMAAVFGDPSAGDPIARRTAAHALTNLGRLAYARSDIPLALHLFEAATALRPAHAEAWVNLGVALSGLGRLDEAARATERGLALEPNRVRALVNAARYRLALGQLAAALTHAERAVRLDPEAADAWALAALADAAAGRAARARERFTRALTVDPNQPDARAALHSQR